MTALAILGLGSIGLRHAGNLLALGCRVVGYDPDRARREALERAGGVAAVAADAALEGVDGVLVCSPTGAHAADLGRAAAAGLHVFVEKPIAHVTAGVADSLAGAEAQGRVVCVGFNLRFHPAVERARALLGQGELGDPLWGRFLVSSYLPDWRPGTDYRRGYAADPSAGGALLDNIHEVDLAVHLLGQPVAAGLLRARSGTLGIPGEDIALLLLRHPHGVASTVHLDYATRPRRRVSEVAGTGGVLMVDLDARTLALRGVDGRNVLEQRFPGDYAGDYRAEMAAFLACVRGEAPPRCSGREALATLECLESAVTVAPGDAA